MDSGQDLHASLPPAVRPERESVMTRAIIRPVHRELAWLPSRTLRAYSGTFMTLWTYEWKVLPSGSLRYHARRVAGSAFSHGVGTIPSRASSLYSRHR